MVVRMEKSHKIWNKNHPKDKVKKGEVIHHKDGNHDNDKPENQQKMTRGEHMTLHNRGNKHGLGNKSRTGMKHSEETKRKIGLIHKGKIISEEVRGKMSEAKIGNKYGLGNKGMTGMKHTEKAKKNMRIAQRKRRQNELKRERGE